MVKNRKGLSYSLEVIISALIIISFTYGIFQVPQGNDWGQYRSQIEAQDLTQTMHKSGIATSLISRGETGSLQTAITTVSDSGKEVSGSVTNIPIGEVEIGYNTVDSQQFTPALEEVSAVGGTCDGDLEDDIDTEQPILRTESLGVGGDNYDVRLYIADTESQFDESVDYNTIWVDNGTQCQFEADEGPYYLEDNFKWGDSNKTGHPRDYFQVKDISASELTLYQSTLPTQIHEQMSEPVNSLRPEVEIDVVDIRDEEMNHDLFVFRDPEALNVIDGGERAELEDYMRDNPVVMMMDLSETQFDSSNFMQDTGLQWLDVGFNGGYSGDETDISFTNSDRSRNIETLLEGMEGDRSNIQLPPAGPITSNTSGTITEDNPAVEGAALLDTTDWSDQVDGMNPVSAAGDPQPNCGDRYEGTVNLPSGNYEIQNTEVGAAGRCPTNAWAVNIDLPDVSSPGIGPYLQGERTTIKRREYTIITNSGDPSCDIGECVEIRFSGNSNVEVVNYRESFEGFDGERLALTGKKTSYNEDELELLGSLMFSMYDSEVVFEGRDDPTSISTNVIASVDNTTYMPYQLRLRWSQ